VRGVDVMRAVRAKALLQRVNGAGADVTEDDPECRNDEGGRGEFMEAVIIVFFHDARRLHEGAVGASEGRTEGR
jgi:hypothetical protein